MASGGDGVGMNVKTLVVLLALLFPITAAAQQQQQQEGQQQESLFSPMPKLDPEKKAEFGDMHFSLLQRRGEKRPINILFMWGAIEKGDSDRFREALEAGHPGELWLASPGGDVDEAINIAHMVRREGLTTRVPAGWDCVSACNFIFMGGVVRYVDPHATFQVHMFAWQTIAKVREALESPPRDFLSFAKKYPNHKVLTPADFANQVKQVGKYLAENQQNEEKLEQVIVALGGIVGLDFVLSVEDYIEATADQPTHGAVSCPVEGTQPQAPKPTPVKASPPMGDQAPMSKAWGVHNIWDQLNTPNPGQPQAAPETQQPQQQPQEQPHEQPQQQAQEKEKPEEIVDFPKDPCMEGVLHHYLYVETVSEEVKNIQQDSAQQSAELAQFLTQMEMSLRFLTEFANIPNDKPRPLTPEELRSFNVVNTD
jgi:hypothetical protein